MNPSWISAGLWVMNKLWLLQIIEVVYMIIRVIIIIFYESRGTKWWFLIHYAHHIFSCSQARTFTIFNILLTFLWSSKGYSTEISSDKTVFFILRFNNAEIQMLAIIISYTWNYLLIINPPSELWYLITKWWYLKNYESILDIGGVVSYE